MIAYDPAGCLTLYPMSMTRFGTNPFGQDMYRIVNADSRRSIVFGQWNSAGTPRAEYCKTYVGVHGWILEKWIDAFTFAGPKIAWDDILGPYPDRGEYQMCGNTSFDPEQTDIEKLIKLVNAGTKFSWAEKLAACRKNSDEIERQQRSLREAIILDCFPAFGHAAFSQLSTGRGGATKTSPVLRSANELGLPIPDGKPGQATTGGGMIRQRKKRRSAA